MKTFVMALFALLFVACTPSPSPESRGPASDGHDPKYLALPIAQKIEIRQAPWSNVLMTVGPRCISGWNDEYARELPRYIKELKDNAEKNETALNAAFAKIDQIKVTSQYQDRCYLTDDSLRQVKKKLDAINSARDVVKQASDSLHAVQSKGIRFYNQIGKKFERSLSCLRQKYYDDAIHVTFMTHEPRGGKTIDNGFNVADDAIMAAAQRVSDMEAELFEPCKHEEFSCSCQRANKVEDLGIIELEPGENPLTLGQKAKKAIVDGCENDKLICQPYKSEPKDSNNSKSRDAVQ